MTALFALFQNSDSKIKVFFKTSENFGADARFQRKFVIVIISVFAENFVQ